MRSIMSRRVALSLCLALGFLPILRSQPQSARLKLEGKVVPLVGVLDKAGIKVETDAVPHWLALVTEKGPIHPIIPDSGSRMFFRDKTLLHRPMQLTGQFFQGSNLFQVLDVRSVKGGKLHEVYYWCDICAIRRNVKMICECCGGPMELHEPAE